MATDTFDEQANLRLNTISEELNEINKEIIANLDTLPNDTELVERLRGQCDDIGLELDALRTELGFAIDGVSASGTTSPKPSTNGSGLSP